MKWFLILTITFFFNSSAQASSILINKDDVPHRIFIVENENNKSFLNVEPNSMYKVCSECMLRIDEKEPLFVKDKQEVLIQNNELVINEKDLVVPAATAESTDVAPSDSTVESSEGGVPDTIEEPIAPEDLEGTDDGDIEEESIDNTGDSENLEDSKTLENDAIEDAEDMAEPTEGDELEPEDEPEMDADAFINQPTEEAEGMEKAMEEEAKEEAIDSDDTATSGDANDEKMQDTENSAVNNDKNSNETIAK
ncbi:MAG: hypothetical protein AB7U85_07010 [Alphaproteobacteria bacterium]